MTQKKISELGVAGTLGFGDLVPVVQGGVTEQATVEQFRRYIGVKGVVVSTFAAVNASVFSWNGVEFDTDAFWNVASRTRFVIPFSGYYGVTIATAVSSVNQNHYYHLRKNGTNLRLFYGNAANQYLGNRTTIYCNQNDYLETQFNQSAGSLVVVVSSDLSFQIEFLGR